MNQKLIALIDYFSKGNIEEPRKVVLQGMIDYIKEKVQANKAIRLNFICTHNSRRSHLGQIWAQTMAAHFNIPGIQCYSGGTESTAVFHKVIETIENQGFQIQKLSEGDNPVYSIKYDDSGIPIICFSKIFDHKHNPAKEFAAIMTCDHADENCPFVPGSEKRIPVKYKDPKAFDGTGFMDEKYLERSVEIASEMHYVFSKIKG